VASQDPYGVQILKNDGKSSHKGDFTLTLGSAFKLKQKEPFGKTQAEMTTLERVDSSFSTPEKIREIESIVLRPKIEK